MQRIGVFICHCGTNIAATVDVKKVVETVKREDGVVFAADYPYMCSENGQQLIQNAIKEQKLTGIVIGSCSPRMHEATFKKAAAQAGLNAYMVEVANLREHCSWIHKNMDEATEKAVILVRTAIAKVKLNAPLTQGTSPVTKRALVIGGGIAGIQAALDIAEAGFPVDIVEKNATIGGRMAQLDKTFPTLDCSACILTPKMVDCAQSDKIEILSYSEIEAVKGFVGNFTVKIRRKARYVDETQCTGCKACMEKCPSRKGLNEFNMGLNTRTAIYIPFAQAIPNVAVIDPQQCIKLKTGKCGICSKICGAHAIDYEMKDTFIERQYGAIVVADFAGKLQRIFLRHGKGRDYLAGTGTAAERRGTYGRHASAPFGRHAPESDYFHPVRRLARRIGLRQAVLLQNLLHVHGEARDAHPRKISRYRGARILYRRAYAR